MASDTEIAVRIVAKLGRNQAFGSHGVYVDDAVNWVQTSDQGRAKELIDEMTKDDDAPLKPTLGSSGNREKIVLTSPEDAVEYLEARDARVPWNLRQ
jgi:hypothetical protein